MDYLSFVDGFQRLRRAIQASSGPSSAEKLIAANDAGLLDPSFLPPGRLDYQADTSLTGDLTLAIDSPSIQYLQSLSVPRTVYLPNVTEAAGRLFVFWNIGSLDLIVSDTISAILVESRQVLWVHSNGTVWREIA